MPSVAADASADFAADLAALAWLVELGADEAIGDAPVDRFEAATDRAAPDGPPGDAARTVEAPPKRDATGSPGAGLAAAAVTQDLRAATEIAAACADLASLHAALAAFDGCALKRGARSLVFADGDPAARVMVVGEAPGRDEDLAGLPFVGRSGRLLDAMLAAIGLSRRSPDPANGVYITNVLPWRPPANRDPSSDEAAMMAAFLYRHIELAAPETLLLLGSPAARAVLGTTDGVTRLRGRWSDWRGVPAMVTFHPAALLRDPLKKREVWADLLALRARLDAGAPHGR